MSVADQRDGTEGRDHDASAEPESWLAEQVRLITLEDGADF